jgi:hypothetical protein
MNHRIFVFAAVMMCATAAGAQSTNWHAAVDSALGRAGAMQADSVYKFGFPRSDLSVSIGDVKLRPALALGSWLAFRETGSGEAMAMGDLVLTEDEILPVIQALRGGGVEQTALHNHLLNEKPHVMYMHVMATGNPVKIARAVSAALQLTQTPRTAPPAAPPAPIELDTAAIARVFARDGKVNGGVYQIAVPRAETIRLHAVTIPPSMGVATAINIQPTGGGRAVATGDFVLLASEVTPVIAALQNRGIEITAIHSHMLDESPRLLFMHFWGGGEARFLAEGLRSALDCTNSQKNRTVRTYECTNSVHTARAVSAR